MTTATIADDWRGDALEPRHNVDFPHCILAGCRKFALVFPWLKLSPPMAASRFGRLRWGRKLPWRSSRSSSDHIAKFSGQRLPVVPVLEGIRRGEVRKVVPYPQTP